MNRKVLKPLIIIFGFLVLITTAWVVKNHIQPFNIVSVLSPEDPLYLKYQEHVKVYNDENEVLVLFESQNDLSEGHLFYRLTRQATESFEKVLGLESVTSITGQQYPVFESDRIQLKSFFENEKLTSAGLEVLKKSEIFKYSYLDPSNRATIVYLKLREDLNSAQKKLVLENTLQMSQQIASIFPDTKAYVLGTEIARYYFMKEIARSQGMILPLVLFVILGLLFYLFRSVKLCALSLFVMLISYACSVALIVSIEKTINPFSSFALLFILIISTADLVHLYSAIASNPEIDLKSRIVAAKKHIYRPCFICAVTTWVGLLSLVAADLPPIINFGIYCTFGVALCFFLIFHVLPYLLELFEVQIRYRESPFNVASFTQIPYLIKYGKLIIFGFVTIMAVLIYFSLQLKAGDNLYRKFVADHPLTMAVDKFDRFFNFTGSIDITVNGPRDSFKERKLELLMAELHKEILAVKNVAHIKSLYYYQQLIRDMNRSISEGQDFSKDPQLKSWFDFFDEYEIFKAYLPALKDQTRLTVFLGSLESEDLIATENQISTILQKPKYAEAFTAQTNGFSTIRSFIFHSIYTGFVKSFLLDFLGIFLCFVVFFRSLKWSLIAIVPNLLPVIAISGIMGILNMTMEYNLIVLVAIIFGIAVDDTTHFLYYLLQYYKKDPDIIKAVQYSLKNTSVALLGTTFIFCVTVPAFFLTNILMFSQVALILILALLLGVCGDMYVLPAMLFLIEKRKSSSKHT